VKLVAELDEGAGEAEASKGGRKEGDSPVGNGGKRGRHCVNGMDRKATDGKSGRLNGFLERKSTGDGVLMDNLRAREEVARGIRESAEEMSMMDARRNKCQR
jgi:hypothetical protein